MTIFYFAFWHFIMAIAVFSCVSCHDGALLAFLARFHSKRDDRQKR